MLEGLGTAHDVVMAKSLAEAISFFGPPGDDARLPLRSSQYWMVAFSAPEVTSEQVRCFLATCQLVRDEWDYGQAAEVVNTFIGKGDFDPLVDVDALAVSLRAITERRVSQTFAASSIAMLANPHRRVFVWNELATVSVRARDLALSSASGASLSKGDLDLPPLPDYATFFMTCERVFEDMRTSATFQNALSRFVDYLSSVAGPMRSRDTTPLDFVERSLFGSLMACEGWYLGYWQENGIPPGTIAPKDEGVLMRAAPRRGQDVFASDLAAKYGY